MNTAPRPSSPLPRWAVVLAAVIVLVFVAAMATQYWQTRGLRADLRAMRESLALARSEAMIGAAAAEAHQGRYEPARQLASRFFTTVQERVAAAPADRRAPLQAILDRRDATITLLSRGDPGATPLLLRLVTDYRATAHGETPE